MNTLRQILSGLLVILLGASLAHAADLRLLAHYEKRIIPVIGIENNRIVGMDGDQKVFLLRGTTYELEGDLLANLDKISWSPNYGIWTGPDVLKGRSPGTAALARVGIEHQTELDGRKQDSAFLARWSTGAPEGGLMVAAWLVDGRISRLAVKKVPSTKDVHSFAADQLFELTPAEMSGRGLLLFWTGGRFVAPAPRFADKRAQAAAGAMILGDLGPMRAALAGGMKPSIKGDTGDTLLIFAAEAGQLEAVDLLLRQGASPNTTHKATGFTALHVAADMGRLAVVERLFAAKADIDTVCIGNDTALHLAVRRGHIAVAEALLRQKADVNIVNSEFCSPYSEAIDGGYAELAEQMKTKLRATNGIDQLQNQLVLLTQAGKGNVAMVEFLISQKISANFEYMGHRPLADAAAVGDRRMVSALLTGGAKVNEVNAGGRTALMAACGSGNLDYARALLEAGADVKLSDKAGLTSLHYAALRNLPGLTELLLAKWADPAARDRDQRTPLELALLTNAGAAAKELDQAGATIDLKSRQVAQLLEIALKLDLAGVIGDAISKGWSPDTKFAGKWPAILVAQACQAERCGELLKKAGATTSPVDGPTVVRATEIDHPPRLVAMAPPVDPRNPDEVFPASLVEIDVIIDPQGRLLFPVVKSAVDWTLACAAMQSLPGWRFTPPTRQGQPVATRMCLPVEFAASTDLSVNWTQADTLPIPLKRVPPLYPNELVKASKQATVLLSFTVDIDGRVKDPRVVNTSGVGFNQPAIDAILKWTFKPGELDGKPAPVRVQQTIVFALQ